MIVKVRCSTCGFVTTMKNLEFDRLVKLHDTIQCSKPDCRGIVLKFGHKIKKSRTAAKYPTYEWHLDHQKSRRNIRKPPRYLKDRAKEKAVDEETGEEGKTIFDAAAEIDDEEQSEWTPPAEFNPAMRLTQERMEDFGPVSLSGSTKGGVKDITPPITGERQKSTRVAMGGKQAWREACGAGKTNAKPYKLGSQDHYEWCHLHGDRLGGTCEASNLVAAHYAVNTYMLAIEEVLAPKTTYQTCVLAYCSTSNVADAIVYRVLRKSDGRQIMEIVIDGRITRFSQIDYAAVQTNVKSCVG